MELLLDYPEYILRLPKYSFDLHSAKQQYIRD